MMLGSVIWNLFVNTGYGSHKYIPADKLTADLGQHEGAGVYGYGEWKMGLISCLLVMVS